MADRYEAAFQIASGIAAGTVLFQLKAGASKRLILREMWMSWNDTTVSPTMRLSRGTSVGTATTSIGGQPLDVNSAASAGAVATAWSVVPTTGGTYHWRGNQAGTTSLYHAGRIAWRVRGPGLVVPAAGSLIMTSGNTTPLFEVFVCWDE